MESVPESYPIERIPQDKGQLSLKGVHVTKLEPCPKLARRDQDRCWRAVSSYKLGRHPTKLVR